MSERRKSRLSKALEEALLRNAMTAPGQQVFLEHTPQVRQNLQNFAKGASIALPAGAADLAGMTAMAASQPFAYAGPGAAALSMRAQQQGVNMGGLDAPPMSGNPIREAVGLDINDPWGIAGEVADPSTAATKGFALLLKAGMTALKTGTKMSGALSAMSLPAVIKRIGHSFPTLPEARSAEQLDRVGFIYNDDIPAMPANTQLVSDVARRLEDDALKTWGGKPMELTDENLEMVARMWANEAAASFEVRPEMAHWYKNNLSEAMQHVARRHPEVETNQQAQDAFKIILAITSNGEEVPQNAALADRLYRQWRDTGQFPTIVQAKRGVAMGTSFATANRMIKELGHDEFIKFLNTDFRAGDLMADGHKLSGVKVDDIVKGSRIFGPKIGGGFMQNLFGNFDPATVDMWAKRTYGRYTGDQLFKTHLLDKHKARLQRAIARSRSNKLFDEVGMTQAQVVDVKMVNGKMDWKNAVWDEDGLAEFADAVRKRYAKAHPRTGETYSQRTELNVAAKTFDETLNKVNDKLTAEQHRTVGKLMQRARDIMIERGYDIDTADVQALLWYAEKDLYAKLGARVNVRNVDYATAFRELADAQE